MNNIKHFENLWNDCESVFKSEIDATTSEILNKLLMSIELYRSLDSKAESEDLPKIKAHLMGELLLGLSHLSLKDNIDVFKAMQTALKFKMIGSDYSSDE